MRVFMPFPVKTANDYTYIGESDRDCEKRLSEHKRAIRNGDVNNALFVHMIEKTLGYYIRSIYLYTLAVSPSLGDSRQHKRNNKNNGGFTPFFQQ